MAKADKATARRALDRLAALRRDPEAAAAFALELLDNFDDSFVAEAAIAALGTPPPAARALLMRRLRELMAAGPKRDPGGFMRASLLGALDDLLAGDDLALAESAATTFEPSPNDPAAPAVLRAAGLIALDRIDPYLATAHAVVALAGATETRRTSPMTGEPAATAARVLAAQDRWEPLLLFVLGDTSTVPGEVVAEALRGLRGMPESMLAGLFRALDHDRREVVQLGLCDLAVSLPEGPAGPLLGSLVASLSSVEVYAYLVAAVVASRRHDLFATIAASLHLERDKPRLQAARAALELATHEPSAPALIARLEKSLTPG